MAGKDYLNDVQACEKKPLWQRIGWLVLIWTLPQAAIRPAGPSKSVGRCATLRSLRQRLQEVYSYLRALRMTNLGVAATCSTPRNNLASLL